MSEWVELGGLLVSAFGPLLAITFVVYMCCEHGGSAGNAPMPPKHDRVDASGFYQASPRRNGDE